MQISLTPCTAAYSGTTPALHPLFCCPSPLLLEHTDQDLLDLIPLAHFWRTAARTAQLIQLPLVCPCVHTDHVLLAPDSNPDLHTLNSQIMFTLDLIGPAIRGYPNILHMCLPLPPPTCSNGVRAVISELARRRKAKEVSQAPPGPSWAPPWLGCLLCAVSLPAASAASTWLCFGEIQAMTQDPDGLKPGFYPYTGPPHPDRL